MNKRLVIVHIDQQECYLHKSISITHFAFCQSSTSLEVKQTENHKKRQPLQPQNVSSKNHEQRRKSGCHFSMPAIIELSHSPPTFSTGATKSSQLKSLISDDARVCSSASDQTRPLVCFVVSQAASWKQGLEEEGYMLSGSKACWDANGHGGSGFGQI